MLKASALYMVIIISLVIGILCSSLIVVAYFYKAAYLQTYRLSKLQTNLASAVALLTTSSDTSYLNEVKSSLFGGDADTVSLKKIPWGVYDVGIARAMIQKDTLYKTFSIAHEIDSTKWGVLYLADEDRPVSVSGKTVIKGDAYLPKAGAKEAYVNNVAYQGDKNIVTGKIHPSDKTLPVLGNPKLAQIEKLFNQPTATDSGLTDGELLKNSFLSPTRIFNWGKKVITLKNVKFTGNIILHSDTLINIDSSATLTNVIVAAKSVNVSAGFKGSCQLFATDSIVIKKNCRFTYPSCIGVMRLHSYAFSIPPHIFMGEETQLGGLVFVYDKNFNAVKAPLLTIAKNVLVNGQVYSQGYTELNDGVSVQGSLTTNRFLYQSSFTRYENYIINTKLDETLLPRYYLTSGLMPTAAAQKHVLQWLESN